MSNSNPDINEVAVNQGSLKKSNTALLINILRGVTLTVAIAALYFLSEYNYLLFHSAVEVFTVVIAMAIFTIAWNTRKINDDNYMLFIGIAFIFVGGFDLLHTLAFKGMGVFPNIGANLATQLWIITRYLFAFSMLIPLLFIRRKIKPATIIASYSIVTVLLLLSIFYWNIFPQAYIDDTGLTLFKVGSEYAISTLLLLSIGLLIRSRQQFSSNVFRLLLSGILLAIATEMSLTLYTDVYGIANMVGHLLDFLSFFLIYKALVDTSLTKPYELLFRNLKDSEKNSINNASELSQANTALEKEITDRKKAEEELERHQKNLERLVEQRTKQLRDSERLAAIGATAGMVGHDIRNPLQAISGDLYFAKKDLSTLPESPQKDNIQTSLETIQSSVEYINKIVQDLQDFAQPLKLNIEKTNLEVVIRELLSKLEIPSEISVSLKIEEGAKMVCTDALVIKRILSNLTTNAVQAMPNGGKITVTACNQGGNVVITVEDTGVGISEETKDKLFTPMFTTKAKGQGFGLAVVKRMTEALGGNIAFESAVGMGAKFTVTIPNRSIIP